MGDPNGIGPEIALKALAALPRDCDGLQVTLFGDAAVLAETAERLGLGDVLATVPVQATSHMPAAARRPGLVCAEAGAATVAAARGALLACRAGQFQAVVACPHHETAIHQAGIAFRGYPTLVAEVCELSEDQVFLLLVGGGVRIVHVTLHESVRSALARLTPARVVAAARAGAAACLALGVAAPRIGVFGINPHASEGGLFGPEDAEITVPAVQALRAEGWQVDDPEGADVLLTRRAHDVYVAMLHDQGHIAIKLLAPQAASALSVGGDVVLASVGHGSAMDIAGQGVAKPDALVRTLRLLAGGAAHAGSVA